MALRIACDLDGTIADMETALQREMNHLFGPGVDLRAAVAPIESSEDVEDAIATDAAPATPASAAAVAQSAARPLTGEELRALWAHVAGIENFWTSLGEIESGAVARLWQLVSGRGWEVMFLTQRPASAGESTQVQSQRWLQAHGFDLPSVFVMKGSRGRVASALALDAVIDDRSENCLDVVADSKAIPMLVWRFGRETVPPGIAGGAIQVVETMAGALDHLERIAADRARPRSFLGRLRSAVRMEP